MAGNYNGLLRKRKQPGLYGGQKLACVSAREIGSAYRLAKQGITGDQFRMLRKVEADAPLRVTGSVKHVKLGIRQMKSQTIGRVRIHFHSLGSFDADPLGLHIERGQQFTIVHVEVDRSAGFLFELLCSGDMIDVRVRDDDRFHRQSMFVENKFDLGDVVAGIYDDCLPRLFVAED